MNDILKRSAVTFISQIIVFILGLIVSVVLARSLGPGARGIYALIILIPAVMLKIGSLGIEAANVYFMGKRKYEIKYIVSNSIFICLLSSFCLIIIFLGLSQLNSFQGFLNANNINPLYIWLAVSTIPFSFISMFLMNIILGNGNIITYNIINISLAVFQLFSFVLSLLVFHLDIFGAVISFCFSNIAISFLVLIFTKRISNIIFSFRFKIFKDFIKYGFKIHPGNVAQYLNYRLDMFLVAVFLDPTAVGYYSIVVGISEKLWMLPGAIATVLFPKVSSMEDEDANIITPRMTRHGILLITITSILLALFARLLITFFFGDQFLPSVTPFLILLPGTIALGGTKILASDLAGRGKPQIGTYAVSITLVFNLILNLLFIPRWGISGAAFASSISYILCSIIVVIAFTKISNISLFDILIIRKKDFLDYKKFLLIFK